MKIIKPQQLVFLKNAYQLDKACYMGISLVAGFYLHKNNHFVTEPEIWDAWEKSPKSVPFLDIPVLKQFAEYVLVGHAGVNEEVLALDTEVSIGPLKKQWRIFGEGSYIKRHRFRTMAMDHLFTWGGKTNKDNPLGKGDTFGDGAPTIVLRKGEDLFEQEPLAAPSPIPYNFKIRKKYLDQVSAIMATPQYIENTYPGYPKEFDLRYFQIAAPDQWLTSHFWPTGTKFSLTGFGGTEETISGHIPEVVGRAFAFINDELIEEIPLFLQTIWLLPDFNMGYVIFTGEVLIEELTEEPYDALLFALDNEKNKKGHEYYHKIYHKRMKSNSNLEFLLDYDLMPNTSSLNVIHSLDNHPSSIKYKYGPMEEKETQDYYGNIIQSIESFDESSLDVEVDKLLEAEIKLKSFDDIFVSSEDNSFDNKNYKKFEVVSNKIERKKFTNCSFYKIKFNNFEFVSCEFHQCVFYSCVFKNTVFNYTIFKNTHFYNCDIVNTRFNNSELEQLNFHTVVATDLIFNNSKIDVGLIDKNKIFNIEVIDSSFIDIIFSDSTLEKVIYQKSLLTSCSFEKTLVKAADFQKSKIEKNSINHSKWYQCNFQENYIFSFAVGLKSEFHGLVFQDCWLEKMGFGNTVVAQAIFEYCNIKEINGSRSDFTRAQFNHCDLMTAIFKDTILAYTQWLGCGLQQNMFYNADIQNAQFKDCNLIGANFALALQNKKTNFIRSLLDKIIWLPKRPVVDGGN